MSGVCLNYETYFRRVQKLKHYSSVPNISPPAYWFLNFLSDPPFLFGRTLSGYQFSRFCFTDISEIVKTDCSKQGTPKTTCQ